MIRAITGMPGEGKSYYAVREIVHRLCDTEADIVTNIPLQLPALQQACDARGYDRDIPVAGRIRILEQDQVRQFFRFRSGHHALPEIPPQHLSTGERGASSRDEFIAWASNFWILPTDSECRRAVHYYIDEVHDFFDAQEWSTIGRCIVYYLTKHRHLGDEVVFITQHLDQVAKQLRIKISRTYDSQNNYTRTFGRIATKGGFSVKCYHKIPAKGQAPYEVINYQLDPKIGAAYNTHGALGSGGQVAEFKGHGKGKLPWWTVWVGFGGIAAGIIAFLVFTPHLVAGYLTGAASTATAPLAPKLPEPDLRVSSSVQPAAVQPASAQRLTFPEVESLFLVSWIEVGKRVQAIRSDGLVIQSGDVLLEAVNRTRKAVRYDGEEYSLDLPRAQQRVRESWAASTANGQPSYGLALSSGNGLNEVPTVPLAR